MSSLVARAVGFGSVLVSIGVAACVPPSRRNPDPPPAQPFPPPQPSPTVAPPATTPAPPVTATPAPAPTPTAPPPATATATPGPKPVFRRPGNLRLPPRKTAQAKGCGEVQVDGVAVPLDCFQASYGAASGTPKMPAPTPPKQPVEYLDHRVSKMEGPVRNQRSVGAGAAFALASVMDQGLIRNGGGFLPISAMHLWARSPKPSLGELLLANVNKGIASEDKAPYDEAKACSWASAEASVSCKTAKHEPPTAADVDRAPFARLVALFEVDGTSGEALRDALLRDQDVLYALRVDAEAWKSVVKSADAEPLLPDYTGSTAVHTVALVGFALQDGQWFYLVKNSWGLGWGHDGYAWIAEATLKKNFVASFVVQVSVASGATIGPVGPHACPPGQLPDSVTKACAPSCPSGGPRKGGAC